MAKKTEGRFLALNVDPYRLHVIVTWGTTGEQIAQYTSKHRCAVAPRFAKDFTEQAGDACGLCMNFSNDSSDVLVWLEKRPTVASTYATLYHELYHAVDAISKSRNLAEEPEARAYLFEHLADQCNRFFWPVSKPRAKRRKKA